MQRIEVLVQELDTLADPVARAGAVELVQAILELHGTGLERMLLTIQEAGPSGSAIVEQLLRDDLIGSLLLLHNLHPLDAEARVHQALEALRPHLGVQGGRVELLGVDGGIARLRLEAGGHSAPSALEEAARQAVLAAAPEVVEVVFEGTRGRRSGSFIPLTAVFGVSSTAELVPIAGGEVAADG
jgi:Fe-S cluster biogenesis protein NfuA